MSTWPNPETLRQSLLKSWQERPSEGHDKPLQIRFTPPPQTFTYSKLYEFELSSKAGKAQEIVIKVPVEDKIATLQREFMALKRLTRHFQEKEDLTVPRPLLLLDQPPALVMTKACGERLVHQVQSCRRILKKPAPSLPAHVRRAGRWLAHLHQMEPLAGSRLHSDASNRYQQAIAALQRCHAPATSLAALRQHLLPRLRQLRDTTPVSLHGDYTLRNILCQDHAITVVDTTLSHTGAAEIDVASFIAALQYIDWGQIWLGSRLYENTCLEHLSLLFLESYQTAGGHLDSTTLDTLIALQCLQRWADFVIHVQRRYSPLNRYLITLRLHRHFAASIIP